MTAGMVRRRTAPLAFILLDFVAGLALLTVLAVLLAKGLSLEHRAAERFAESRAATALAERALAAVRAGGPAPADARVEPLGPGPGGLRWVRVTVGRSAVLYGLAREAR